MIFDFFSLSFPSSLPLLFSLKLPLYTLLRVYTTAIFFVPYHFLPIFYPLTLLPDKLINQLDFWKSIQKKKKKKEEKPGKIFYRTEKGGGGGDTLFHSIVPLPSRREEGGFLKRKIKDPIGGGEDRSPHPRTPFLFHIFSSPRFPPREACACVCGKGSDRGCLRGPVALSREPIWVLNCNREKKGGRRGASHWPWLLCVRTDRPR